MRRRISLALILAAAAPSGTVSEKGGDLHRAGAKRLSHCLNHTVGFALQSFRLIRGKLREGAPDAMVFDQSRNRFLARVQ